MAENDRAGAKRGAGGREAGTERKAGLGYRNRLEHGAALSPLTLSSHALNTTE